MLTDKQKEKLDAMPMGRCGGGMGDRGCCMGGGGCGTGPSDRGGMGMGCGIDIDQEFDEDEG